MLALGHDKATVLVGHRRQRGMAAAAAVLLFVALTTVISRSEKKSSVEVQTGTDAADSPGASSTSVPDASASPATGPSPPLPQPQARPAPAPVTVLPPTTTPFAGGAIQPHTTGSSTTTTLVCRNSLDPACGPFRWDPQPTPSQPLTVTVTVSPAAPRAGDTVSFRVVVDDPDGGTLLDHPDNANVYGDGIPSTDVLGHIDCIGPQAGPWTPPDPTPVHLDATFQHVYRSAGTYTATFTFKSLGDCAHEPSEGTARANVVIRS